MHVTVGWETLAVENFPQNKQLAKKLWQMDTIACWRVKHWQIR